MPRPRIALSLMPLENRRDVIVSTAVEADRLGYHGFFMPETWSYDMTVLLADIAARTRRITVGTGILGIWNRTPATIAMAAATLAGASDGRFVLGLGTSTPQLAEGLHDVRFDRPLAQMRRTVAQVRALLGGERVPLTVTTAARPLKLNLPAPCPVPIYLAALGDASTRLAGEIADGWMPFFYPRSMLGQGGERLREGARRGGHPDRVPEVCVSLPTVVAADAAKAREGAAWFLAFYLTTMGAVYRDSLTRQGFGKEVESVLAANSPRPQGIVPADADRLLDEIVVFGTPAEARQRLARWHAAGAATTMLLLRAQLTPDDRALALETFRPMLES